jgi:hypothetical protein
MKNLARNLFLVVGLFAATVAFGGVPPLNVTVSDAGGKAAFKGSTDKTGAFTTAKVKPGIYVVQFTSPSALKGNYSIVVSAGVKKVSATSIAGEKFAKGGVALKVDVQNLLNIVGQVTADSQNAVSKNGKKMVWMPPQAGSHMPGKWVEVGSAEWVAARTAGNMSTQDVSKIQSSSRSPGQ